MTDVALLGGAITLLNLGVLWMTGRASRRAFVSHFNAQQAACRAVTYANTARRHSETAMRAALGRVGVMVECDKGGKPAGREMPFTHDGLAVETVDPVDAPFASQRGTDPVLAPGFRDDVVAAGWSLATLHIDERGGAPAEHDHVPHGDLDGKTWSAECGMCWKDLGS
jgi:hypothetical protein